MLRSVWCENVTPEPVLYDSFEVIALLEPLLRNSTANRDDHSYWYDTWKKYFEIWITTPQPMYVSNSEYLQTIFKIATNRQIENYDHW